MTKYILTIELVPSTSWFDNVRSAVTTSQWDFLRKKVYNEANNICEVCGGKGKKHPVECHEIWDYNDKKLIQKLERMIALCPDCHMVKHIGLAQIQGKFEKAILHLMKVNKINKNEAMLYIKKSFDLWNKRSAKKWQVDISELTRYGIDFNSIKQK